MKTILLFIAMTCAAQAQFMPVGFWRTTSTAPADTQFVAWASDSLVIHLKADTISGHNSGDTIYYWPSYANAAVPGLYQLVTANKPKYYTNVQNGKPAVRFDGSDDVLGLSLAGSVFAGADASTIMIVANQDASGAQNSPISWGTGSGLVINVYATYNDVVFWDYGDETNGRLSVSQTTAWDGRTQYQTYYKSGDSMKIWTGDTLRAEAAGKTARAALTSTNTLYVGTWLNGSSRPYKGDIMEVLVFKRPLTPQRRSYYTAYLKAKYNLP